MSSSSQQYEGRERREGTGRSMTYTNKQHQARNNNQRSGYSGNSQRRPHNKQSDKPWLGGDSQRSQHYRNKIENAGDTPKSESAASGSNHKTPENDSNPKKSWEDVDSSSTPTLTLNPQARTFNPATTHMQQQYCGVEYPDTSGRTDECQSDVSMSEPDHSGNTYKHEEQYTSQEESQEQLSESDINDSVANAAASFQDSTLDSSELETSFDAWNNTVSPNTSGKLQGSKYKSSRNVATAPRKHDISTNENFSKKATSYESFENKFSSTRGRTDHNIVTEMEADLFEMDESYALANCVASDFNMGSGIAVRFRQEFKNVNELLAQRQTVGGLGVLKHGERYVYYLVTKRESAKKPTYESLFKSLERLREHMIENNVKKLAIPRLGCGLDRLEWNKVKFMLEEIFASTNIAITVCNFQKADESMNTSKDKLLSRKCPLQFESSPITRAKSYSIIVYLGTVGGHVDSTITELDNKFGILRDYKKQPKKLGDIVVTNYQNYKFYILGCIVKEKLIDHVDFAAFGACMRDINKENNKFRKTGEQYQMIAIDSYYDPQDELLITKLTNLMKNTLYDVTVYVYGSRR